MPFVKLDCGILNSTLWFERDAREIFITALLMAEPFELLDPAPQIQVDSLELTGWVVPPGWYGFVPAAGVGIVDRAKVPAAAGYPALRMLGEPEISSRTPDFDGRRMVRINGGYLILNFIKYREKDATNTERQRRWRERQKAKSSNALDSPRNPLEVTKQKQKQSTEAEDRVQKQKQIPDHDPAFDVFWDAYPISKGKKAARMAWHKLAPSPELQATILASVEAQKATRQWAEGFARMRGVFQDTSKAMGATDVTSRLSRFGIQGEAATNLITTAYRNLNVTAETTGDQLMRTIQLFSLAPDRAQQLAQAIGPMGGTAAQTKTPFFGTAVAGRNGEPAARRRRARCDEVCIYDSRAGRQPEKRHPMDARADRRPPGAKQKYPGPGPSGEDGSAEGYGRFRSWRHADLPLAPG